MPATEHPTPAVALSAVVPVYRNADTLEELHARLAAALQATAPDAWELLLVDDACPHGSLAVLRRLAEHDPRVGVVVLVPNVGQHRAIRAGLAFARGDAVVVLDADLQDPPEAVPVLVSLLGPEAAAVFAGRRGRYESVSRLAAGRLAKWLLHHVSGRRLPADAGLFVAMTAPLARRVVADREPNPHVLAAIARTGLPLVSVPVRRDPRPSGRSAYSQLMRLRLAGRALRLVRRRSPLPPPDEHGPRPVDPAVTELVGVALESGSVPVEGR
jgi:glycosyltransferase involved in cell wall biosynthesis